MLNTDRSDPFYVALWVAGLKLAKDPSFDPLPPELEELAAEYFEMFPPKAKA